MNLSFLRVNTTFSAKIMACLFVVMAFTREVPAQQDGHSTILKVDYRKLISRADLTYQKPVERSEEGLPIGNGRMGSLVWTTPQTLRFQVNRMDVFGNNAASNNFFERNTDYCSGVGFVDIGFPDYGHDVFSNSNENFKEHLSCYDGTVTVEGEGVSAQVLAWNEQDVMAVRINDQRSVAKMINASLRMLRDPETKNGNHVATSKVRVEGDKIVLTQVFTEDDYYCSSAVVIGISGRQVETRLANDNEVRLSAHPGNGTFDVFIASAASFDQEEDVAALATKHLDAAISKGYDGLLESNLAWWHQFWEKAFIHLHSNDDEADFVEQNYNYYLYVMASSSRGKYPPKFNGMLWSTKGDARQWGNLYWEANQSCLYNALFPTNRMELLDPMFDMYSGMYQSCATAAQQQWGSKGIYIPETVSFGGLPELPDTIASEMRELYLLRKSWGKRSGAFNNYALTKMPYLSRWNWKKDIGWKAGRWQTGDKGGGPFGHVTHIFSRGAKIAYQYWMKYEFTQDKEWLKNRAYPMLRGVAEFYRNFPNVRKEADGKYHIRHINDNESIWDGHNTVEEISSMMGIFPAVARASEILDVDADMRPVWQEFIDHLSPLPLSADYPEKKEAPTIWVRALPGAAHGNGQMHPDANTMPEWFFDLCNLESGPSTLKIANATYDSYFPHGINEHSGVYVLSKLPLAGVILGRAEATKYLISNQIRTAEVDVMPNRMDMREGYETTNVERLGRAAEALEYALCQGIPSGPGKEPVIHVFPAWPNDWDAQFTLLCRGGFLVTSSIKGGKIGFIEIKSQVGTTCSIRNPWPGKQVTIYRNGKKWLKRQEDLISFPTMKNDHYVMVVRGDFPDKFIELLPTD